jgi:hypothetical protein
MHGDFNMRELHAASGADVAMSVAQFCERNNIGITTAYAERKRGRLAFHKVGRRTIILPESEAAWRKSLPTELNATAA